MIPQPESYKWTWGDDAVASVLSVYSIVEQASFSLFLCLFRDASFPLCRQVAHLVFIFLLVVVFIAIFVFSFELPLFHRVAGNTRGVLD